MFSAAKQEEPAASASAIGKHYSKKVAEVMQIQKSILEGPNQTTEPVQKEEKVNEETVDD